MDDNMNKRPSFQFYPADWLKDPSLQRCSFTTKGVWINMLCVLWECEPMGEFTGNRKELVKLLRCSRYELRKFLDELRTHKFGDLDENGQQIIIKCRRLCRLREQKVDWRDRQRKHRHGTVTDESRGKSRNNHTLSSISSSTSVIHTQDNCIDIGISLGISEQQSKEFHTHYVAQGWLFGGGVPITDLRAAMVRWRNNQYKFEKTKNKKKENIDEQYERLKKAGKLRRD